MYNIDKMTAFPTDKYKASSMFVSKVERVNYLSESLKQKKRAKSVIASVFVEA